MDNLVGPPIDAGVAVVALKVGTNIPAIDVGGGPKWRVGRAFGA